MGEREEALEELANEMLQWAEAYPTDVFTEPTPKQVDDVCKMLGFRLDHISAMVLRAFTKQWAEKAKRALSVKDSA